MSSVREISPAIRPRFCLFIPWTRHSFVEQILANVNAMYLPRKEMEVVFYVDTDNDVLWDRLYSWCLLNQFAYNGVKMIKSGQPPPLDLDDTAGSQSHVIPRRIRIAQMKNDSRRYISATHYVFGLEDDTLAPHASFEILYKTASKKDTGFVMGVQQGRWNLPVLGAWRLDDVNEPTTIETVPFEHENHLVEIDGGGYFCYLTKADLYREHEYYFWAAEPGGPDVTYGFELRKKGYKNYMDFRVICEHLTDTGTLIPSPQNTIVVKWNKSGERWVRQEV